MFVCHMFASQAVDSSTGQQRAIKLIDVLCDCDDALFPRLCEALITDGQRQIVDNFLRRNVLDADSSQQPGRVMSVCNSVRDAYCLSIFNFK